MLKPLSSEYLDQDARRSAARRFRAVSTQETSWLTLPRGPAPTAGLQPAPARHPPCVPTDHRSRPKTRGARPPEAGGQLPSLASARPPQGRQTSPRIVQESGGFRSPLGGSPTPFDTA